jgi:shikimate kinase
MSMSNLAFESEFNAWLDMALSEPVPESVIAFNFNLYEPWSIEIIGSDTYSENDPNWASDGAESFRPAVEALPLQASEHSSWKEVLEHAANLVRAYLERPGAGSQRLRRAQAVAIGFVDGELRRLWPK